VLTTKLHLSINVLREVLDFMVAEQVAEVAWRGDSDLDVQYQLTSAGKQRASAWLERCAYAGPAPVTLEAYRAMVERQATQAPQPCADELAAEFTDDFWRRRCSACWARPCMPAAACCCTGRPAAASRRWRGAGALLQGLVAVPHAMWWARISCRCTTRPCTARRCRARRARAGAAQQRSALGAVPAPVVALDASLDADMLDLQPDAAGGCYRAPPQLKANNGLLIVDDLGRQRAGRGAAEPLRAGAGTGTQRAVAGGRLSLPGAVPHAAGVCRQRAAGVAAG
jgi:hypothetical protein